MTKFPLEHAPFPPLNLIASDRETLLNLADVFVTESVEEYERHVQLQNGRVNSSHWVRLKQLNDVVVYQHRQAFKQRRLSLAPSRVPQHGNLLSLLWTGTIPGELDDVMFAIVSHTAEDVKIQAACVENNVVDTAVLQTLVNPTPMEPFRGVHVKWAVQAGPPLLRSVMRCRDFVYLETTGMTHLSSGERLGYRLLHSISLPGAPQLHELKLVRAKLTLYHLFRQKYNGVVETYVKAFVDLLGDLPMRVATTLATSGLVAVAKLGEFALLKKLQWKLRQRPALVPGDRPRLCRLCHVLLQGATSRRRTCNVCRYVCCARCCVLKTLAFVPTHSRLVEQRTVPVCTNCLKTATYTNGLDIALHELKRKA